MEFTIVSPFKKDCILPVKAARHFSARANIKFIEALKMPETIPERKQHAE